MNTTRQLDKQIAKILYGDNLVFSEDSVWMATSKEALDENSLFIETGGDFCLRLPEWSSEMGHAWELVRRMIKVCRTFSIGKRLDGWVVRYEMDTSNNVISRMSECEAICECFIEVFKNDN